MKLLFVVCLAIFASACAVQSSTKHSNSSNAVQLDTVKITSADNGKTVSVSVNQPINVLFTKQCVGCRYVWSITSIDSSVVAVLPATNYSNDSNNCIGCTGGTVDKTFHFIAKKIGSSPLGFKYFNETFQVTVNVK